MRDSVIIALIVAWFSLICCHQPTSAQDWEADTTETKLKYKDKYDQFYDSLKYKAERRKFTKWLHNALITEPKEPIDKESLTLSYFNPFKGRTISDIEIKPLDVFGPNFSDTARQAKSKLQRMANTLHTKTNLNIIRKNLLFKIGDQLNPELLYENERIIRALPFIKDVKFLINPDSLNSGLVRITVLTKDVFSFGVTGSASGLSTATFELYNQNIFGAGHQIAVGMVGHLHREPYLGFETFYRIPNIKGKFINLSVGFSYTYRKEGFSFNIEKEFLTASTKWGGGISALRLTHSDRISELDPVRLDDAPLNFTYFQSWGGRTFQFNPGSYNNSQFTISGFMAHWRFFDRPLPDDQNKQYFANNTFYLAGLAWSKRRYMRDQLIYSYGITEDIPEGFKHELVFGYNANEFGDRLYTHLSLSNGNLLPRRPGYLYCSGAIAGFLNNLKYEQGLINIKLNYISRLITAGEKRYRLFARLNYTTGIKRFDVENLLLKYNNHIRGFISSQPTGKQRLSIDMETVFFQQKEIYNFNIAFFAFADLGIIGSNKELIFKEDYYAGLGIGIRLHNESLVLKTFHLRLAFYPNHPDNMGLIGFVLEEQLKKDFYSFQPDAPVPIRFQ